MNTRRGFIKLGLAGAAGLAGASGLRILGGGKASAQNDTNLIIALAYGGWDPVWVMDPKPDSREVDLIPGDVRNFGDLPIWVHDSRPEVTRFFEDWGSITTVLNGVSVESLAHETCIDITLAGRAGGHTPDLAARVAQELGDAKALPYLALSPQAEYDGLEAQVGELGPTNQLMALLEDDFAWPRPTALSPDPGLAFNGDERAALRQFLEGSAMGLGTQMNSPRSERILGDYNASLTRMGRLRQAAGSTFLSNPALFAEAERPFQHVAAAISEGISQTAIVQPNLYWDTHSYNDSQGPTHNTFFAGLNELLGELYTRGSLERTAVLVVSEMGRTPLHNPGGGKDHWLWTSSMLISPRANGGKVFGQTDDWLRPAKMNLATGALDEGGTFLHAEHVLAGVANVLGLDADRWYNRPPLQALAG